MGNFKTKARAIELLGRKQIRDSVTALAELMKNSYDADAPWLRVEFEVTKERNHIIIADGGNGMTQNDIEEKWLVLGTDSKTNNKGKKSPGGRTLMGAKGIGRLASARLGKQLWMMTKNIDGLWNMVYINWNLFENPYLSLGDIQIPVKYGIPADKLAEDFLLIRQGLIMRQKENLELRGWFQKKEKNTWAIKDELQPLYQETLECIEKCSIDLSYIKKYLSIQNGTVLFIDWLNDDNWEKCFAPSSANKKSEDIITEKYFNRLASFVSGFRQIGTTEDPFDVKVYVNSQLWEEDYSYIDEDYNLYDIKIEGKIKDGKFYGTIDAKNGDEELIEKANCILREGREVTQGIADWEKADCGEYSIKLCHIEGMPDYSGLAKDDYFRLKRKLEVTGGVCIYRDGVRVLPYGEPENDFLNLEERRSYNAGNYIFSHRNFFGRIDINSHDNPKLEDKSSREGLIENAQYFYFIKTMENLLIDLGFNFLSDARKDSLAIREDFVKKNRKAKEEEKRKTKIEKEEKRKGTAYAKELETMLQENMAKLKNYKDGVVSLIHHWGIDATVISTESGYNQLTDKLNRMESGYDEVNFTIKKMREELTIVVSGRYLSYCSESLLKKAEDYNLYMDEEIDSLERECRDAYLQAKSVLEKKLEEWNFAASKTVKADPEQYKAVLKERLQSVADNSVAMLEGIKNRLQEKCEILHRETEAVRKIIEDLETYDAQLMNSDEYKQLSNAIHKIPLFESEINKVFDHAPEDIAEEGDKLLEKIEDIYQEAYKALYLLQINIDSAFEEKSAIASRLKTLGESAYSDEYLIGKLSVQNTNLKSENEIYSDLANLGLASEIVSHEFNQLYTNVRNAVRNLAPYVKETNAKYWLRQIEVGFRAVSDRQNQLSPMYRSYSLRKRNVNLKGFVDEICSFMGNLLEKEDIMTDNQIDGEIELNISPSKMFPAISNIVNNASYWVLNQKEKIIRFRYDEIANALYIEDSGTGIMAVDKESIFRPFVSYKPNGRGLGLTIVKKVLDSQGYGIAIADEKEKTLSGACFKITFSESSGN